MSRNKLGYNPALASLIIRVGLAAVFSYAAVDAFRHPNAWISFVPPLATHLMSAKLALDLISAAQLGLAVWLVVGIYVRYSAIAAVLLLGGIMLANPDTLLITFRDVGLVAAAAALPFLDE